MGFLIKPDKPHYCQLPGMSGAMDDALPHVGTVWECDVCKSVWKMKRYDDTGQWVALSKFRAEYYRAKVNRENS